MDRLLVVCCPHLLNEDEGGTVLRSFISVIDVVEVYCPWVTVVRPGICSLPARGPARYFGGEDALVRLVTDAVTDAVTDLGDIAARVEVGVADGLFAAVLAAHGGSIVPPGGTRDFLAPFPLSVLENPALNELLTRLGIHTLGEFASLPETHVLGRLGSDGIACHLVARGQRGELGTSDKRKGLREPATGRHVDELRGNTPTVTLQSEFWGGTSDADIRAARALTHLQRLLGPDGVVTARLQGGRNPTSQARFVTWNAREPPGGADVVAPWPGRIPPPAPVSVHCNAIRADLAGADGAPVVVSGRGLLTATPTHLSIEGARWVPVIAWAGPWPTDEWWWSRSRRRSARMQVVTDDDARLLLVERGQWWVEATYG
jgi:hypothetical protein